LKCQNSGRIVDAFRAFATVAVAGAGNDTDDGSALFVPADGKDVSVRALKEAQGNAVVWDPGEGKGKSVITVTPPTGESTVLREGEDYYIDGGGTARFYNNVRTILEMQERTVTFVPGESKGESAIRVTTAMGALAMTLKEGEDYYIGRDGKAHYLDGPEPPGGERPGAAPPQPGPQETPGQTQETFQDLPKLIWPVDATTRISDTYMSRNGKHRGVDFDGVEGAPIYAIADGIVLLEATNTERGLYLYIDHGNGIRAIYQHNSTNLVTNGATVKQGETIAHVGHTGKIISNHGDGSYLHFELFMNVPQNQYLTKVPWSDTPYADGYNVNPLEYIKP
jgi:murein DD-endopeptidase MepM/ murein hydrolase activator NlpD